MSAVPPRADLSEARRLLDAGLRLVKLKPFSKAPEGEGWNLRAASSIETAATGYGALLADNHLCSVDPDNYPLAKIGMAALGFDLDALLAQGVRTESTRPGSGGRSTFRAEGEIGWLKFACKDLGMVLELRAESENLQDCVPGLVYRAKDGAICTQRYANGLRLDEAPPIPDELWSWWERCSTDRDFLHAEQQRFFEAIAPHVGAAARPNLSLNAPRGDTDLPFAALGIRGPYNREHDVESILDRHGYAYDNKLRRWSAPSATGAPGIRPVPGKEGLWRSDHGSDPLCGTFDAWIAHVVLDHAGDCAAAINAWREQHRGGADASQPSSTPLVRPRADLAITFDEMQSASLAPRCIVENYLHADVGAVVAPGGVGKTTMLLHEIVSIALKRPVWGMQVHAPGWVLFVTNEDPRERLTARLREIMQEMRLSEAEQRCVLEHFIPLDLTGTGAKLVHVRDGNIEQTSLAGELVRQYRSDPPALVVFDPLVSFGASEAMVNDNEQALINVGRYLVRELGCCVRFVHHTGKQAARDGVVDQYAGRGGSALADGCRMVAVLATWDGKTPLPAGCKAGENVSIFRLERPKLSYARPNQPTIWIRREGFAYQHFIEFPQSPDQVAAGRVAQLERYLEHCVSGRPAQYHTRRTLEDSAAMIGMTRAEIRGALATLEAQRRVVDAPVPPMLRRGGRKAFLCPSDLAAGFGEVAS